MITRTSFFLIFALTGSLFRDSGYAFSFTDPVPQGRMTATTSSCNTAKWKVLTTMTRLAAGAAGSAENNNFSDVEISKMNDLIIDLSMERDDTQRRNMVAQVSGEKLLQPYGLGSSDRFVQLFDEQLNKVGNDIRTQAAADAEQGGDRNERPSEEMGKQLWALVDMMVQSKIIFRQAREDGLLE